MNGIRLFIFPDSLISLLTIFFDNLTRKMLASGKFISMDTNEYIY